MLDVDLDALPYNKLGVNLAKLTAPKSRWSQWAKRNGYKIRVAYTLPKDRLYLGQYAVKGLTRTVHTVVCYNGEVLHDPAENGYELSHCKFAVWFERI